MKEKITLEQLIASIFANYKTEISFSELANIVNEFKNICDIYKEQYLVCESFRSINKYITYNSSVIKLKDNFSLNTAISKDYNLKEGLLLFAGSSVNNFITYYITKECNKCNYNYCKLSTEEKNGNNCLMWENNRFCHKLLHKRNI